MVSLQERLKIEIRHKLTLIKQVAILRKEVNKLKDQRPKVGDQSADSSPKPPNQSSLHEIQEITND